MPAMTIEQALLDLSSIDGGQVRVIDGDGVAAFLFAATMARAVLRLRAWRPINFPGDDAKPVGQRPRSDWPVLAVMLSDLALLAVFVAPVLRPRATSGGAFVVLMIILALIWLGPFLGVLLRRGRGAALLCYGVGKLIIPMVMLASWWANRPLDETTRLPLLPITWHLCGLGLVIVALLTGPGRRTSRVAVA